MKKALFKDSIKEIKNTHRRFLSILLMAFLGVGFFAGIRATSPDMVNSIDTYFDNQNMYDIQVISTLGLTQNDIDSLRKIEGLDDDNCIIEGSYETEGKLEIDNKEIVTKVLCVGDLNKPYLVEGKLPENNYECVVEQGFLNASNKKIGDKITLDIEDMQNDEGEDVEYLKNKEMTIVGTVKSPMYITSDRGTSSLGSGKVNYYIYISKDNINNKDTYTNIYIKLKEIEGYETASYKYEKYVEDITNKINEIKEEREKARHDELINISTTKVDEAQKELDAKKQEVEEKIKDAEEQIENAKEQIKIGETEIKEQEANASKEFSNAEDKLDDAKAQIKQNEEVFNNKEIEANEQINNLNSQKQELENSKSSLDAGLAELQVKYNEVLEILKNENLQEEQKQELENYKNQLYMQIQNLNTNKKTIDDSIAKIDLAISQATQQIEDARKQIENAKVSLSTQETKLNTTKKQTKTEIENAKSKIEESKNQVIASEQELEEQRKEADTQIQDAETKLIDARQKIEEIESPKWYVLDRNSNTGYASFVQDKDSIENIGRVFPIVFFLVAILISLTSMTRMVEEQRVQIGTLKALGYNKIQIASKYIIYASLACIIGGILGMCVGFILIPTLIWRMYEVVYNIPEFIVSFNFTYGSTGLLLISICIIGATIYSIMNKLKETPATLMRPRAPKIGKRVLLERINFIWKRLSFTRKVTIRNIFRYKKRFLMTIIGISGCTALILAGFGLKDSIGSLIPGQYEKIFNYDMQITLKDGLTDEQKSEYINTLSNKEEIENVIETNMLSNTAINGENEEDVQIIVPLDESKLDGMINLYDKSTDEKITLGKEDVCITDKTAELLGIESGDKIILRDSDDKEIEVTISNIVENYIYNYIYMTKETYEELYGEQYNTNVLLTKDIELSEEEEENLATNIMNDGEVASISMNSSAKDVMDTTMDSLNYVVVVLIVSAGLLAFVVLYNLSNVNISERIRELATIKVLGFYDKEVYSYVTRETVLLTIIGIVIGLIGGYFLNYFIIGTCEIDILRFNKIINPLSYLYAILITTGFTIIVNIFTYFALKKIDMIENLKSIE